MTKIKKPMTALEIVYGLLISFFIFVIIVTVNYIVRVYPW